MDHHPGVLGLHNARGGIGIGVVEPGAVLVGGGGDGGPGGVGVGSQSLGNVLAHQVGGGGMSDDGLVLIDDEDIPLAVNTLPWCCSRRRSPPGLNQSQGGNYILERWQRHGRCKHQCVGSGL